MELEVVAELDNFISVCTDTVAGRLKEKANMILCRCGRSSIHKKVFLSLT